MRRIWMVDDTIPIQVVFGASPPPACLVREVVQLLLSTTKEEDWEEDAVRSLCLVLSGGDFEPSCFLSPEAALDHLKRGSVPPDALIFDWQGPGFEPSRNVRVLREILASSFASVQVYTHLSSEEVEPHLVDLRTEFEGRILPTRTKADVTAVQLREQVRSSWEGTIAGDLADSLRDRVRIALERTLIEMCGMPQAGIAALVGGNPDDLINLMLAKVRDQLGVETADVMARALEAADGGASSNMALRRLMSAWYYFFPTDDRVRRGDLVESTDGSGDGELRLVVTPSCYLHRFRKKTGGSLTLLTAVRLDGSGLERLRGAKLLPKRLGTSITAGVSGAADAVIPLLNVPAAVASRSSLEDYLLLFHSWETLTTDLSSGGGDRTFLRYVDLPSLKRRCTLAEPFAGATLAKIAGVVFAEGVPDLPDAELIRIENVLRGVSPSGAG